MKSRVRKPVSAAKNNSLAKNPSAPNASLPASFPVVAVGASAGGLEAYTDFFHALPINTGMAFVLIQHLDPKHHSLLAEILSKATRMPVEEVQSGVSIRPNRVYVIPSNAFMALNAGAFTLTPRGKAVGLHL